MTPVPLDVINPQPRERMSSALRAVPDRPGLHAAADEFSGDNGRADRRLRCSPWRRGFAMRVWAGATL